MSKQVNYNENLCAGAAIRDDKGRRISKLFEASHPKMTVGYAKNLIMPDDPTEQEFNFRQSGGGVIEDGVAVIDKVKGNSVVWNQLIGTHNTAELNSTVAGVTISTNTDERVREYTLNGTATEDPIFAPIAIHQANKLSVINGHKYLIFSVSTSGAFCQWKRHEDDADLLRGNGANIIAATTNGTIRFNIRCSAGTEFKNEKYIPRIIDLTQMFGAGNEPTTYEEFLQRKPKVADEYAYNEGEIINNKVEAIKTSGVNLWDEEWELGTYRNDNGEKYNDLTRIRSKNPMACTPSTTYYAFYGNGNDQLYVYFYDENMGYITSSPYRVDNRTFTSPSNARFFTLGTFGAVTTTYNHDICINVSDPSINGKYFPYEKRELDLAWVKDIKDAEGVKLFEDGMRSAGTAFDEVAKGRAIKRVGVVNLGNLNWEPGVQTGQYKASDFKQLRPSAHKSLVCANYTTRENGGNIQDDSKDLWVWNNVGGGSGYYQEVLVAKDTRYSSAQAFKQAVQGVLLYYELAEPIEVEYDEKSLTYPVVAGGTEEAIASEPSSAFRADIGYGIDAVKTILDLKARVEALEGK